MRFRLTFLSALFSILSGGDMLAQDNAQQNPQRTDSFQRFFTLPEIEFSEEQQMKVQEIRKEFLPKLTENRKKWDGVITSEQVQARREALQKARSEGKEGRELQNAANAAIKLTDEQRNQRAAAQKERDELSAQIRTKLIALLTEEQRRTIRQPRQAQQGVRPTHANVKYGPHERNVMDVWLAKSDQPTPVLVSTHGGGFRGGNKSVEPSLLSECLNSGISVVAITYRLSDVAIAPAQHMDSARAIQFIRHNAKEWKLDPKRIAATGGSAGAGLSLWLGFHDDLADPKSNDPVLRQSTHLTCMSVYNGQTSYDPRFIRKLFPDKDTFKHPALSQLFDVDLDNLEKLPKEKYELFELVSAINHLSKDDVPVQLNYASQMDTPITSQGVGIHHPKFAQVLKDKMDPLGIECQIHTGVRRGSDEWTKLTMDFVKKHLGVK